MSIAANASDVVLLLLCVSAVESRDSSHSDTSVVIHDTMKTSLEWDSHISAVHSHVENKHAAQGYIQGDPYSLARRST